MPKQSKNKAPKASIKPEVHNKIQGITSIKTLPSDGFRNMLYEIYDYLTGFRWHHLIVNVFSFSLGIGVTGLYNWVTQNSKETFTIKQILSENKWHIKTVVVSLMVLSIYCLAILRHKPKSKEKFLQKYENYDGLQVLTTEFMLSTTPITPAQTDENDEESPNG